MFRQARTRDGQNVFQYVVPKSERRNLFDSFHGSVTAGHLYSETTLNKLEDRVFWPSMRKDVEEWCSECYK